MQVESECKFEVMLEKPISYSVNSVHWAQAMDLLVFITESNSLEVFRLGEKAQKVFQLEEKEAVTSIDLSPDSNFMVYGRLDGAVQIVRTENGEKVFFYENSQDKMAKTKLLGVGGLESVLNDKNKHPRSSIEAIRWVNYLSQTSWDHLLPFTKGFKQNQLVLSIAPHPYCDKNSLIKIRHLTQNQTNFSLLLSSERDNTYISLNGMILIATLTYSQINLKQFYILHSTYSDKIYSVISHTPNQMTDIYLVTFNCKQFNTYKEEIVKVNYLMSYAGQLLRFIERSYKTVCAKVKEIVNSYNNKITISPIDEQPRTTTQAEDMYRLLTLGIPSKDLVQFITKQLYDTPYLQKIDDNLTAMFSSLHQLTLQSAQNVVERLVIVLKRLIEMRLNHEALNKFYVAIKSLYKTGEILLIEATQAKFDIRNLLIWLNKLTIRNMNEVQAQTTNVRSNLNKYMVDTNRLRTFLKDQSKFNLSHLINLCLGDNAKSNYEPEYKIYNNAAESLNPQSYKSKLTNYNQILRDLDLPFDDNKMEQEVSTKTQYQSIEIACREAANIWLTMSKQPIQKLNNIIGSGCQIKKIDSVGANSNYLIKTHSYNDFMTIMYTQSQFSNSLLTYNCITGVHSSLNCPKGYYVADISITSKLVLILLRSLSESQTSFVGQLDQQSYQKGQMIFSKRMQIQSDVCTLSSSEKGLSSVLINKNKLIVIQ